MNRPSSISHLPSPAALAAFLAFVILHSSFVIAQPATGTLLIPIKTATGTGEVQLAPTANRMLRTDGSGGLILSTDGSFLTGISASNITTGSLGLARLAQGGATTGQVLAWTGSAWAAQDAAGGVQLDDANTWTNANTFTHASAGGSVIIAPVWNTVSDMTALKVNVTNTASGSGSKLMDLQVGGASKVNADKDGVLQALRFKLSDGSYIESPNAEQGFRFYSNTGELAFRPAVGMLGLPSGTQIIWGQPWGFGGTTYTVFGPTAANILAQRNGTNAQEFRLYNTYDGTNDEWASMKWDANLLNIGTVASGTGNVKPIRIGLGMPVGTDGRIEIHNGSIILRTGGTLIQYANGFLESGSGAFGIKLFQSYLEINEMVVPPAPAANAVRIYSEDNGAGKTRLMALFPSGAAQQIAIEP